MLWGNLSNCTYLSIGNFFLWTTFSGRNFSTFGCKNIIYLHLSNFETRMATQKAWYEFRWVCKDLGFIKVYQHFKFKSHLHYSRLWKWGEESLVIYLNVSCVYRFSIRDWYTAVLLCSLLKHGFNEGEHSKSKIPQSSNAEVQSKFNCWENCVRFAVLVAS